MLENDYISYQQTNEPMNSIDREFIICIESDNVSMITKLLEAGVNVHVNDDYALKMYVNRGNIEIVTKLLEYGANVHSRNDGALKSSAKKGFYKIVSALLEHGADVHACDNKAIMFSVVYGHPEITASLLAHGANGDKVLRLCVHNYYFSINYGNNW